MAGCAKWATSPHLCRPDFLSPLSELERRDRYERSLAINLERLMDPTTPLDLGEGVTYFPPGCPHEQPRVFEQVVVGMDYGFLRF